MNCQATVVTDEEDSDKLPEANSTRFTSATPSLYQYFFATPPTMSLTSIDWKRIGEGIEALANATASIAVDAEYGPDHVSTGTGLTGCIPNGSCNPVADMKTHRQTLVI
jgi:hypothetical protein